METKGLSADIADKIGEWVQRKGGDDIIEFLKSEPILSQNEDVQKGIHDMELLFAYLDRASSGIGLNTDVPKEVTSIMQGVIILTIVIAYEVVRRMTARRQLREQHDRA